MKIDAELYDGSVTAGRPVVLSAAPGGRLRIEDGGTIREHAYAEVDIAARIADTPRRVVLADGSACIATDNDAIDALDVALARAAPVQARGRRFRRGVDRLARLLDRNALGMAIALTVSVGILFAVSRWGAPALGTAIVSAVPPEADAPIGQQLVDALDQIRLFQPTALAPERQDSLRRAFDDIRGDLGVDARLEFRQAKLLGANAFAVAGGTVILTDAIVEIAAHDEELIAVLAHELGHVRERHWLRMVAQSAAIVVIWTAVTDPTLATLAGVAPVQLLELSYSREFEREADEIAFDYLTRNGIPPTRLQDLLKRITASCGEHCDQASWLSSHPPVEDRSRD